jgi:hypothetical protein
MMSPYKLSATQAIFDFRFLIFDWLVNLVRRHSWRQAKAYRTIENQKSKIKNQLRSLMVSF